MQCLGRTASDQKALKVLVYKPAGGWSSESSSESLGAVTRLDLDTERTQNIDAPASSRCTILFPFRHWCRYRAVHEPVTTFHLDFVVVSMSHDHRN